MRCLTYRECADWCRDHGYPVIDADYYGRPAPTVRELFPEIPLRYPADSGQKVELARAIVRSMPGELLFWVGEWAVWPSSQHMPLFTRLREAWGEKRPLIEAPGHLLGQEELDDAVSILAISLLFIWDCHVFSKKLSPIFFCSHDEWNGFFVPPGCDSDGLKGAFANWSAQKESEVSGH